MCRNNNIESTSNSERGKPFSALIYFINRKSRNFKVLIWIGLSILIFANIGLVSIVIISIQNTINPAGIVIHHSAVPFPSNGLPVGEEAIDEIHRRKGYGIYYWGRTYFIGYHYIILPDGTLQQGRPESCKGAHTTGYNDYTGICLIGDFSPTDNKNGEKGPQQPTEKQLETLVNLVRRLRSNYNISAAKIYTHHDLNPETECPGENFQMDEFKGKIGN